VQAAFKTAGVSEQDMASKVKAYFQSADFKSVPFVRTSCLLWAAIARKASRGLKEPPGLSMVNDVQTVSALLPYCDAMFIDNSCRALLTENPIPARLGYPRAMPFSKAVRDTFTDYLDRIETDAPAEHFEKVAGFYGDESLMQRHAAVKSGRGGPSHAPTGGPGIGQSPGRR
jgi:hypothetical protein